MGGATTLSAGALRADTNNSFSPNSALTMSSGAGLDLNSFSCTIGGLAGDGLISLGSGALTVANNSSTTFAGTISGSTLAKTGSGTLTLTNSSNSYLILTLNQGTLSVTSNGALGTEPNSINVTGDSTLQIGTTISMTRSIDISSGQTLTIDTNTFNLTNSRAITGSGGLTKISSGTLFLSTASNTYGGTTTISGGTLQARAANSLSASSIVSLANTSGATLNLNSFSNAIGGLSGGGTTGGNVSLGSGTLSVGNSSSTSYGGVISGTGGLTKTGSGTLTLTGANTYSGTTTVSAGTLQAGAANAFPSSMVVSLANTSGAILDLNGFSQTITSLSGGGTTGGTLSLGAAAVTVGNSSSTTFAGSISGTGGSVIKVGSGTLTLSGTSNYTGGTTISAGALNINSDAALGDSSGAVAFTGNVTLRLSATIGSMNRSMSFQSGTTTTFDTQSFDLANSGTMSGSGVLRKTGAGTLTLSGTNSFGNPSLYGIVMNQGTVAANSNAALGNVDADINVTGSSTLLLNGDISMARIIVISNNQTITVNTNGFNFSSSVPISGTLVGFTKTGSGTATLSYNSNTYFGTTTINGGTLRVGASGALSNQAAVVLANTAGAILDLNNFNSSIVNLSGGGSAGGDITLGSGTLTTGNTANTSFGGAISGTGGITKNGSGIFTLTGINNTYAGTTRISGGTLQAGAANSFSPNSACIVTSGTTLSLNNFNNVIASLSDGGATGGFVTLGSAALTVGNSDSTRFNGAISGTGGSLIKTGSGTLTLAGTNSYTGGTTINAGTLNINANAALGNVATALSVTGSSTLQLGASISSMARAMAIASGQTLTIDTNEFNLANSGTISGVTGTLAKIGNGTLTLTGTNSYGSGTTIQAGTLNINADVALGSSGTAMNVTGSSTLQLAASITDMARAMAISSGQTLTIDTNGFDLTNSDAVTGSSGALTKMSSGTLTLMSTSNTYGGTTTISGGVLQAGAGNAFSPNSAVSFGNTSGAILDLNGFDNTVPGISGGGAIGGTVSLGSSRLTLGSSSSFSFAGAITGASGGITKVNSGTQTLTGTNNTYGGSTSIDIGVLQAGATNALSPNSPIVLDSTPGATLDLNNFSNVIPSLAGGGPTGGGVTLGSGTLTVGSSSSTSFAGAISGATGGLTKTGSGTLTLTGTSNTYGGTTTVNNGTLRAGAANALSSSSAVVLADAVDAILDLNSNNNAIASLSGGGTSGGNVTLGTATLTVGNSSSTTYAGVISGTGGAVTKVGSGTLSFSGSNTYTGLTTIQAGRLSVNGSIAGAANVNSGATLGGIGTISGNVTVDGILSLGNSIGTIHIGGDLTLNSGSTTAVEIDSTTSSLIDVTGQAFLAGQLTISVNATPQHTPYTILTAANVDGTWILVQPRGYSFTAIYSSNEVQIELSSMGLPLDGLHGNERSVANYLNSNVGILAIANVITQLIDLPDDQVPAALDSISPSRNSFTTFLSETTGLTYNRLISSRMANQRLLRRLPKPRDELLVMGRNISSLELLEPEPVIPSVAKRKENRYSFWMDGIGEYIHLDAADQNPAFGATVWGTFVGLDYYGVNAALVGGALGYAKDSLRDAGQMGNGNIDFYIASLYGTSYFGNGYLELSLSGSYNRFENERKIAFTGYDATAKSSHSGWQIDPHLALGYDISISNWDIEPFIACDAATNFEAGYKEHGGGTLDTQIRAFCSTLVQFQAGSNFYQTWQKDWGVLMLKESVSYLYQKPIGIGHMVASMVGFPGNFTVTSLNGTNNLVSPTFEMFFRFKNNLFLSLTYEGQFNSKFRLHEGVIKTGYNF